MSTRRIVAALVRHGEYHQPKDVPSALLPHPLTERGIQQSRALGQRLHDECRGLGLMLDPILDCSTLLRSAQTATLAAGVLNSLGMLGMLAMPGMLANEFRTAEFAELVERSVGAAANLSVDAIAEIVRLDPRHPALPANWKSHPRFRLPVPGAESLLMAGARVAAHIERRAHELRSAGGDQGAHAPEGVLKVFIGHGGSLRHAAVCMGALALDEVPKLSMHHGDFVFLEHIPAADGPGRWQKVGGQWKVRSADKPAPD
jgi:2,3-bisphosphoglycerate-dependent phosphoglycerate mutase